MIKKEQIRMVKHVILWKLKEELTDTEKEEVCGISTIHHMEECWEYIPYITGILFYK